MSISPRDEGSPRRDVFAVLVIPALALAFHLATHAGYGYFRDELYYIANGRHLGFGYVEHPPLIGLLAALVEHTLGTSLFALRFLPAVAHAVTIAVTAAAAAEMGGRRLAQVLAALAAFVSPAMLGLFFAFSMNPFDILCWTALWWVAARYLRTADERWWILFGVIAGIGLENKISVLFLGAGLVAGLLLAGPRTAFRRPHLWAGGGIAVLLFLPHVVWQAVYAFPTREFIRNATEQKNVAFSPLAYLGAQAINILPALPVCLAGLGFLIVAAAARRYRALGWAFLAVLAVMLATNAKAYYLVPAYGVLFAAGGVAWERLATGRLAKTLLLLFLLATGALLAPFAVPLLSEDAFVAYAARLGASAPQEERQELGRLPQFFADMHGWPELAATVAEVHRRLPAGERAQACVFAQNYGEAGAIDLFGPRHGLPPAISGHNSYYLWGPGRCTGQVLIVLDGDEAELRQLFASVERAGTFTCRDCMPYENHLPIWVARGLKPPMRELWPRVKKYI